MLKQLAMHRSGVLRGLFCLQSTATAEAHLLIANPLPAKSIRTPKAAQELKRPLQLPVRLRLQKEQRLALPTIVASKSTNKKLKLVQMEKTLFTRGNSMPTLVSKTRQDVKQQSKQGA
jgi:hypothetical protein